jgi:hypothetical protein
MALEEIKSTLKELKKKRAEFELEIKTEIKTLLEKGLAEILEANPILEGISWKQYIPGWNDGDVCHFQLSDRTVKFNDDSASGDNRDGYIYSWDMTTYNRTTRKNDPKLGFEEKYEIYKEIESIISVISKQELENIYGDGSRVTVTRAGVNIEDYYDEN